MKHLDALISFNLTMHEILHTIIWYFRCEPGLIPKPDTITGCGPECVIDPDCQGGYVCENQKCIPRPDPCDPSPCGPGAICTVGPNGNPICRSVGNFIFSNYCDPNLGLGHFIHQTLWPFSTFNTSCEEGLIPALDTIQGCVECLDDYHCKDGFYCKNDWEGSRSKDFYKSHKCTALNKPCDPSPCGPWICMVIDNESVCRFLTKKLKKTACKVFTCMER